MLWDPSHKPRLRPLEAFRLPDGSEAAVGIRDRSGLSDVVLALSEAALQIMALMDGAHACAEIQRKFHASNGGTLSVDALLALLERLEEVHFLEGSGFEAYYEARLEDYRRSGVREMLDGTTPGIADNLGDLFESMLDGAGSTPLPGRVVGLIAPHLDYPRGKPCYTAAYSTLKERTTPDCVVILGTNHFGRSASMVATASDFTTPLGTTSTDLRFLERLEARCGNLRTYELDHRREHSVELQVAWLQHLFGADSFEILPFLCPDPCGPTGTAPYDGKGVDLHDFAVALGELIEDDERDILLVAGADLSHVGAAFGDEQGIDDALLEQARRRDRCALDNLGINDPAGFIRSVAESDNPTRVCSAGCIFALTTALPRATGTVLRYHQAVDRSTQTCVTCAAVAFTSDTNGKE